VNDSSRRLSCGDRVSRQDVLRPPRHRADASTASRTTRELRTRPAHQPDARPECRFDGEQAVWPYGESESAFTIFTGVGRRLITGSFSTVAIVLSSSSGGGDCKGGRIRDDAAATAACVEIKFRAPHAIDAIFWLLSTQLSTRAARIWKSEPANVTSFLA
jgi:hypothetical protein